ncbi:MAG: hypothetical protein WDN46_18095 [Methylocella sp.]
MISKQIDRILMRRYSAFELTFQQIRPLLCRKLVLWNHITLALTGVHVITQRTFHTCKIDPLPKEGFAELTFPFLDPKEARDVLVNAINDFVIERIDRAFGARTGLPPEK